jgi:hypothetical protein
MSGQPKRRETAEEREERRRKEIEGLMASMERTAPKADTDLLKSLRQVELAENPDRPPGESLSGVTFTSEQAATRQQTVRTFALPSTGAEKAPLPSVSLGQPQAKAANEDPELLERRSVESSNPRAVRRRRSGCGNCASRQKFQYPDTPGAAQCALFSRVTMVFAKQRIDKTLVFSYLLYTHVPAEGLQRVPRWLLEQPPKMLRPRILVFIKDEGLARRVSDTAIRFGVTEADIIENIVRKHLPEAPFQYKPERRMRFSA